MIDDGSHLPANQLNSLGTLFPLLEPGGVYVIEDVETSYWPPDTVYLYGALVGGNAVEALKPLADCANQAAMGAGRRAALLAGLPPGLREACAWVSGVEFAQNMVVIHKHTRAEVAEYADRVYVLDQVHHVPAGGRLCLGGDQPCTADEPKE